MAAAVKMHERADRKLRSAGSDYNCMGLVFACRRTVIDVENLPWILKDDGYKPIEPRAVVPGDLLVYDWEGAPTHVGIVWEHEPLPEDATWKTRILSQWGRDGEYFHAASDVPDVLGKPHQFWTERVTVDA